MDIVEFDRNWIIENSIDLLSRYTQGITLRQLYYRLVSRGMVNDIKHYKKLIGAMTKARWDGDVSFDAFIDRERSMYGESLIMEPSLEEKIETAKDQITLWMETYSINRWASQPYFVEVWIEKKALQGVFERPCRKWDVALAPCKGYPSLTFLYEAKDRLESAISCNKKPVILYFGDYDPSGENIPVSIKENLCKLSGTISDFGVEVVRCALNPDQIKRLSLVGVPPKISDSRTRNWNGKSAVECDAIEPEMLSNMCEDAIASYFDDDRYSELQKQEEIEKQEFIEAITDYFSNR